MSELPPTGRFNVAKCIRYLRMVNVDVTPEMEAAWLDAEKVTRFLRKEAKPVKRLNEYICKERHDWIAYSGRGRKKTECPECGQPPVVIQLIASLDRYDNVVMDVRPKAERWKPLPEPTA